MQQFKCSVAIGWPDFTWQQCEVIAVITNGVCGNINSQVVEQVKKGLTKPAVFVVVLSVTPM
jgi:hypothetical protein